MRKFLLVDTSSNWIDRHMIKPGMIIIGESKEGGRIRVRHDIVRDEWVIISEKTGAELFIFKEWSDLYTMDMCKAFIKGYRLYLIDENESVHSLAIMSIGDNLRAEGVMSAYEMSHNLATLMIENDEFYTIVTMAVEVFNERIAQQS